MVKASRSKRPAADAAVALVPAVPSVTFGSEPGNAAHLLWVQTLYELGQAVAGGSVPQKVHHDMLQHIVTGFGAQSGSIALHVDAEGSALELVAGTDLPPGVLGSRLSPAVGVFGHVLATGTALLINGNVAETNLPIRKSGRPDRSKHSTMCWPLRVNNRTIGAVAINRLPEQPRYTVADLDRGQVVTNLLALVVANHRMHVEREGRIHELSTLNEMMRRMNQQLEEAQDQLMQSEKLASIGQIAAGVAHEINNPIGYVLSNLGTLGSYLPRLFELCDAYIAAESAGEATGEMLLRARAIREKMKFDYVRTDTGALMTESLEGIQRVKNIVQDLKNFSRGAVDEAWERIDLHEALDRMLNIARSEIKYKVKIETAYGDLPRVECQPSRLHQVFLNLLVNAAQAIEVSGTIRISTGCSASDVWVCFEDTGCGIPSDQLKRIFDPFFTTKEVGEGTGLGLSVSYAIVHRHNGRIDVESELGKGSRFTVRLPVKRQMDYQTRPLPGAVPGGEFSPVESAPAL